MKKLLPGVIFATVGLALLEGVSGIINSAALYVQTAINVKTAERRLSLMELSGEDEEEEDEQTSFAHPIGFIINDDSEEDDDNDE